MTQRLLNGFPCWALLFAAIAYYFPDLFISGKAAIIPLLALVMFGMGMTLTWTHFKFALSRPGLIVIGVCIQFLLMPFFAYWIAKGLSLEYEQLIGLVLVGCSAGGTASNVICYLARGHVALSILMTMTSTLCAVFMMPLLTWLYLHQTVPVPALHMMQSIAMIVLAPVLTGTAINSLFAVKLRLIQGAFPFISSLAIILIIAIIVAINHANLSAFSMPLLSAVILHNLLGMSAGYMIPRWLHADKKTCRTLAIEVGMQNSGLSVALAVQYFSAAAALPGALFSIWHNISGALLATYWRRADND